MEENEAIELAVKYAKQHDIDTNLYDVSKEKSNKGWDVHFVRNSEKVKPRPGDFFTVLVDSESKTATEIIYGK